MNDCVSDHETLKGCKYPRIGVCEVKSSFCLV